MGSTEVQYLNSNDSGEQPCSNIWPQVTVGSLHTPGFSITRTFPENWPSEPGTHMTLLQSPHGHGPEFCLALPLCTAAGGTRHKFPLPIYHLGLGKNNFPWVPTTRGAKGQQYPQFALGPVLELWPRGSKLRLATWRSPVLYQRFLDKKNFSRILTLRVQYPQDSSTQPPYGHVPELCRALPWRTAAGWGGGGTRHRSHVPV